jgi:hypothetical protein
MIDFKVLKAVYPPRAARAARENKRPGYTVREEFMNTLPGLT